MSDKLDGSNKPTTMRAIRLSTASYSASNPAPASALRFDKDVAIPKLTKAGEVLVEIKASPVIRDELTWPESYEKEFAILGHDFSGIVVEVFPSSGEDGTRNFEKGDEVFGMVEANKAGIWAEFAIVELNEVAKKPKRLSWEQAAAVPLSALTAWQALFVHGKLAVPDFEGGKDGEKSKKKVLITGASGGVGIYLVQLAKLSEGVHVTAGSTSKEKNWEFLEGLGADEVVEYSGLAEDEFDVIIDAVGGETLEKCWAAVKPDGKLISIESGCFSFVEEHRNKGLAKGKENVDAKFFIVESNGEQLDRLSVALEKGLPKVFVAQTFKLEDAVEAYEVASGKGVGRGKVVLIV